MEYYAKSKKNSLSSEQMKKVKNNLQNIIEKLDEYFSESEIDILNHNIVNISKTSQEKQKTLKEHQDDIVRCAEMFFLEYGEYFTEKEKHLVIEACRMHDWGKANLVFQGLVNSVQVKDTYSHISRITQIPHGFLSAVTISGKEFKKL